MRAYVLGIYFSPIPRLDLTSSFCKMIICYISSLEFQDRFSKANIFLYLLLEKALDRVILPGMS